MLVLTVPIFQMNSKESNDVSYDFQESRWCDGHSKVDNAVWLGYQYSTTEDHSMEVVLEKIAEPLKAIYHHLHFFKFVLYLLYYDKKS